MAARVHDTRVRGSMPCSRFHRMLPVVALALLPLTTGCQAAFQRAATEAPRGAVPAVVDETLKAGEDPRTRQRLVQVLETPEMKRAIAEIARSAVAAALEEASAEASEERVAE